MNKNTIYIFAWGNNPRRAELKGRPCKVLNDGSLNSCEVIFVDTGEHEIVSHRGLRAIKCTWCQEPLIETDFNRSYCLRQCNNLDCRLYAERQGLREISEEQGEAYRQRRQSKIFLAVTGGDRRYKKDLDPERRAAMNRRQARPGYKRGLDKKKEYYHELKKRGYTCKEAMANSSKKRMRELGIIA